MELNIEKTIPKITAQRNKVSQTLAEILQAFSKVACFITHLLSSYSSFRAHGTFGLHGSIDSHADGGLQYSDDSQGQCGFHGFIGSHAMLGLQKINGSQGAQGFHLSFGSHLQVGLHGLIGSQCRGGFHNLVGSHESIGLQ